MPKDPSEPEPYKTVGKVARFYKAIIQMVIGTVGVIVIGVRLAMDLCFRPVDATMAGQHLFTYIGLTLGLRRAGVRAGPTPL